MSERASERRCGSKTSPKPNTHEHTHTTNTTAQRRSSPGSGCAEGHVHELDEEGRRHLGGGGWSQCQQAQELASQSPQLRHGRTPQDLHRRSASERDLHAVPHDGRCERRAECTHDLAREPVRLVKEVARRRPALPNEEAAGKEQEQEQSVRSKCGRRRRKEGAWGRGSRGCRPPLCGEDRVRVHVARRTTREGDRRREPQPHAPPPGRYDAPRVSSDSAGADDPPERT